MKMFFDDFDAALEEAKFCAESEKRKYIIKRKYNGYEVYPKTRRGIMKPGLVEVGFKDTKHENKNSRQSAQRPG